MPSLRATIIFGMAFFAGTYCGAETIKLRNGQTVEGKILKEQKDSILVDVGIGMPVTYFRDEIKDIAAEKTAASDQATQAQVSSQADGLEARAVGLIDEGKMDQGVELLRQALALDPNPQRHMNYGSILFGNGVEAFKQGKADEGKKILQESEAQLKKAIEGFTKSSGDPSNEFAAAQAYFLLGEMHANAFADPAQAKTYYEKAVALAAHDGAKAALAKPASNSQNP